MEVKRTSASVCSSKLYRQFKSLNFRKRGETKSALMFLRGNNDFNIIHYAEEDGRVISWSLSYYKYFSDRQDKVLTTHVYTRRWKRSSGAGFKVFESLREYCKETEHTLAFHPWNERSNIYFTKCIKHCPDIKIELRYYAPLREVMTWKNYDAQI